MKFVGINLYSVEMRKYLYIGNLKLIRGEYMNDGRHYFWKNGIGSYEIEYFKSIMYRNIAYGHFLQPNFAYI